MNITERIDRLPSTPLMRKILFLVGIGWLFDACDQGMVSGVLAAIGGEWTLSQAQMGLLSSIGLLGMGIGAALSGMAADRFGRRKVIMVTLLIYGLASALSAFSVNYDMLIILRFITGFGLGGELPAASTLVSEFSPTRIRGRNVVILESFWAWGWIVASLVAYLLIPEFGWRSALLVGGVPALFAAVLRAAVPESPRYLEQSGDHEGAGRVISMMEKQAGIESAEISVSSSASAAAGLEKRARFAELWSRKYLVTTIVLWVIWFGINFGYYGFVLWTPTLLMAKGFTMVKSFEFTLVMCLAQLPGYGSAAYLVEKIGRKPVLIIYFIGTALASWLFGNAEAAGQVVGYGCMLYFFSLGAWGCVYAYTPEVYPTRVRGTGTGWAAAFGRLGAFLGAMVVPVVYSAFGEAGGYGKVFILLSLVFAAVAAVAGFFGKETRGRSLENISE